MSIARKGSDVNYSLIVALSCDLNPGSFCLCFQVKALPQSLSTSPCLPIPHPEVEGGRCIQHWGGVGQLLTPFPSCAVVFPQDLLEKGLDADNFAMLGLGDIVIPGDWAGLGWGPRARA